MSYSIYMWTAHTQATAESTLSSCHWCGNKGISVQAWKRSGRLMGRQQGNVNRSQSKYIQLLKSPIPSSPLLCPLMDMLTFLQGLLGAEGIRQAKAASLPGAVVSPLHFVISWWLQGHRNLPYVLEAGTLVVCPPRLMQARSLQQRLTLSLVPRRFLFCLALTQD